ncbi:MAG: hypothetical protein RIB57_02750 [Pelagibacterium sp.]|jgi:hypothetical protein|uniref:hypothetical protein n=1 Tax=Pelagibacterium sp. TaxID=1967288 RepID=UPI0032EE5C25|tara:strand:+ start:10995 stop:11225 length:231 start_codon:yes stop_codon:yes gene_type:complete
MTSETLQQRAVCGQAEAVLENLGRSQSLPSCLSLSIEEIIERAWELAYRRNSGESHDNVIVVPQWAFRNKGATEPR